MKLGSLYATRFPERDRAAKDSIWRILCQHFFQRYVDRGDVVLDLGAGFGEFLRHIECAGRVAVDVQKLSGRRFPEGTLEVTAPSHQLTAHIPPMSVDVVFASNVFEHLPDTATFLATLGEIWTVLRPTGRLLALQPNIRFVGGSYWDFVDHHLPLTDRTLVEACESVGFEVTELIPRFLPYTTRGSLPTSPALVRLYLKVRPAWWLLGKQTWLVAKRSEPAEFGATLEPNR
jgi:SAM-dependent methyltransferase